jgi:hypothetical protein
MGSEKYVGLDEANAKNLHQTGRAFIMREVLLRRVAGRHCWRPAP